MRSLTLCLIIAYFLGSIPFGYIIVLLTQGRDIRRVGSGNVGATNVLRTAGIAWGILTLLLDTMKGAVAVLLTAHFDGEEYALVLAALTATAGHMFTPFLGFRGGKGVATALGSLLMIAPSAIGLSALVFFFSVLTTRYISVGSILAAFSFPWWTMLLGYSLPVTSMAVILALLIIIRHSANIRRLRQGTENRFSWGQRQKNNSDG